MLQDNRRLKPRIYVASIPSYESYEIKSLEQLPHGAWIDASLTPSEIKKEIETMLEKSDFPKPESWFIYKYEDMGELLGFPGEVTDLNFVSELGQAILVYGESFLIYMDQMFEPSLKDYLRCYQGYYRSEKEFAEEYFCKHNDIPRHLEEYIDYSAIAEKLFNGEFYSLNSDYKGVYVFSRTH